MVCPQCKAEYRPGFTRCADCDVDLLNESEATHASRNAVAAAMSEKWPEQLWRGTDPHYYLSLMGSLSSKRVPCYGRPAVPPAYDSIDEQPAGSFPSVEFEVRVSASDLTFARWVMGSDDEMGEEEGAKTETEAEEETSISGVEPQDALDADLAPDTLAVCPLCSAEFNETGLLCPNCEVPLRHKGSPEENAAKVLCDLHHPQFIADLLWALSRERIPFNNCNFSDAQRSEVLVLDSAFDRATQVLAQVLQYWEFDRSFFLWPPHDPRESYWPARAKDRGWLPEDMTVVVWAGTRFWTLDSVEIALCEHRIAYRVEVVDPGSAKIFIHPEDEETARDVVRDVVEGPRA